VFLKFERCSGRERQAATLQIKNGLTSQMDLRRLSFLGRDRMTFGCVSGM
jgi:hypothetical protein